VERLTSRHNPLVQRFRELARTPGATDAVGTILLDGAHLVEEALRSGVTLDIVAFGERHLPGRFDTLAARAAAAGARTVIVSEPMLAAMSPVQQPSGVVALARRDAAPLDEVFAARPSSSCCLRRSRIPATSGRSSGRRMPAAPPASSPAPARRLTPSAGRRCAGGMGSTFRLPVAARLPLDAVIARARAGGLRVLRRRPPRRHAAAGLRPARLAQSCSAARARGSPTSWPPADERITIPMRAAGRIAERRRRRGAAPLRGARQRGEPP
jgi:hypothetical protein